MTKNKSDKKTVKGNPTKRFFVQMLVRDIELDAAVLDLLDNSVDGAIRSTRQQEDKEDRYSGYWAKINIKDDKFVIHDNCGGIPNELVETAFMLGRPEEDKDKDIRTVGMYGIGMKRSIFKMGNSCKVISQRADDATFKVTYSSEWMNNDEWDELPYEEVEDRFENDGTKIEISDLKENIHREFFSKKAEFINDLRELIATHFCIIIHKGFKVYVNEVEIVPKPITFRFAVPKSKDDSVIAPYVYQATIDDVEINLVVGFMAPPPSDEDLEKELEYKRIKENAGWTIVCNDRIVVYKDKTSLTGWGTPRVPGYHSQFIHIAGIVEFNSNNAMKLPVRTTKRGIETSSTLYYHVLNYMQEGLRLFTSHTNRWKRKDRKEELGYFKYAESSDIANVTKKIPDDVWTKVKPRGESYNERKYQPNLPKPSTRNPKKKIAFTKLVSEIERVSEFLFEERDIKPSMVGEECFNYVLEEAEK